MPRLVGAVVLLVLPAVLVAGAAQRGWSVELLPRNSVYVPANLTFDSVAFRHVGLRLKGNSSLLNSWRSGVEKLPFRLNVDELGDQYPGIRDQTFFGFPNLNLSNNSQDSSHLHAKVVGDLFGEAGVPASRTAFVRVFLDRGDGNLYKPAGTGARWRVFDSGSFPKKANEDDEDWTDVQGAMAVLNESRTGGAAWRALNTVIGNTDTYGSFSPHNYYLYGSPRHRDRLFWIPWDHDLSLNAGMGGFTAGADAGIATLDLFHERVDASWSLIRYLLDDPAHTAVYARHVEEVLATVRQALGSAR